MNGCDDPKEAQRHRTVQLLRDLSQGSSQELFGHQLDRLQPRAESTMTSSKIFKIVLLREKRFDGEVETVAEMNLGERVAFVSNGLKKAVRASRL